MSIRWKIPVSDTVLIRLLVLIGLLIGLLSVGILAPHVPPELMLLALAIPPIALLAIGRLEYGVLAIMLAAAFVRFTLPTGTASRIVTSLVVTIVLITIWLLKMLLVEKRLHLKPSTVNAPLLGFILSAIVSYVWSNAFRDPLVVVWRTWPFVQLGGLAVMILLPGAFFLTSNILSEVRWLKILCWLIILTGTLALADNSLRLGLSFVNTGGLFSLTFVSISYAQALFNKKLRTWLRLTLFGLMGTWMYIYFIRRVTWLSGWLPPLAAIAVISLMKSKKILLIFVLLIAIYVGLNWDYYAGTVLERETAESGHSRLNAWKHNWKVTSKHLLFGTGPAGYAAYYMSYFPGEAMATHSNYIDILSQTGIVGLFFCLWFFGALGWTGYKLRLRLKESADFSEGFANAMLGTWAGCIVAMGLGDWMFPFVYTQTIAGFDYAVYSWVLLAGIITLSNIYTESDAR